jgi:hypothetical protein
MDITLGLLSDDVEELEFDELPVAGVDDDCKRFDRNE